MRVTERAIFENGKASAAAARERQATAADRASTGIAVRHAWDSSDAARIARERIAGTQAGAIATAAERTYDELVAADNSLASVVEDLSSMAELAVQLANSTYSTADRARAAEQVRATAQSVIAALNVQVGGRFVFSGTADQSPAFDAAGVYLGDGGVRQIEAAPGVLTDVSVRANAVISGANGGVDVLAALERMAQALEADDVTALRASLGDVQRGITQVAHGRSTIGAMQMTVEATTTTSRAVEAATAERKAAMTDADFVDAATELALAERGLEATLAVSAKSFKLSLLDRI
jgi:flagellar hook-associated protein 3 FlgL